MTQSPSTSRQIVAVDLGDRSYEIVICSGGRPQLPELVRHWQDARPHWKTATPKALLVTDTHVGPRFAESLLANFREQNWSAELVTVPAGEVSKSFAQAEKLYDALVQMQADRKTVVVAVGGGVIGDLAGFAAATYGRGVPFVQVPTTLLADVDSSVGGKVGINHPQGKNLIGAFHQPLGVLIDTECLQTLPQRDYFSGLAEVVKYGVILDAEFFEFLEEQAEALNQRDPAVLREVIARSCQLKADVVEEDEYERSGLRAILNYGHTFAHAYEALCGYGQLTHGEAVAIGMIDASLLAEKIGRIEAHVTQRQIQLLEKLQLPTRLPQEFARPAEEWIACMRLDKKTESGRLRFVLPSRIGHVQVVPDVPETAVREVLDRV